MALRLRVVSDHRRSLGDRGNIVFGVGGGTIGRSADNDWVLPDPLRYVSAHHARVSFRQGAYFIEDLSTNGAFVNDGDVALNKLGPHRLANGDLLRFGDYQVSVVLEAEAPAEPAAPPSTDQVAVPTSIHGLRTIGRAAQTDIGASLDLDALLIPDPGAQEAPPRVVAQAEAGSDSANQSGGFRPVNAYGQAVARVPRRVESPPVSDPEPEPDEEAIARRIARLAKAASKDPRSAGNGASAPALYDVQSGLQAFCRGAGIGAETLPVDAHSRMLHLAGQLLRESLLGLKESHRTQQEQRNQLRVTYQKEPTDLLPSLDRHSVEELIQELLKAHDSRRFDAVQWLRESFADGRRHDDAMVEAMRAAFVDFIGRLDPLDLATRFERSARRKTMGNWELYGDFYRSLCEMQPDTLPHIFVETFAQNYEQKARGDDDGASQHDAA